MDEIPQHVGRVGVGLALEPAADAPQAVTDGPGQAGQALVEPAVVAPEVTAARLEPVAGHALRRALDVGDPGSLADQVDHPACRDIPAGPPGPAGPQAEIDLLVVEEVALIHQADGIE